MAESKLDIKDRVGKSPDIADGAVLLYAYDVQDKLPDNELNPDGEPLVGQGALKMADHQIDYGDDYDSLYN